MQASKNPSVSAKTVQSVQPKAPTSKPVPLPLGADVLRQVSGGTSAPNSTW
jgi:hypothetical protein